MIDGKLCMGDATAGGWSYVDYLIINNVKSRDPIGSKKQI